MGQQFAANYNHCCGDAVRYEQEIDTDIHRQYNNGYDVEYNGYDEQYNHQYIEDTQSQSNGTISEISQLSEVDNKIDNVSAAYYNNNHFQVIFLSISCFLIRF